MAKFTIGVLGLVLATSASLVVNPGTAQAAVDDLEINGTFEFFGSQVAIDNCSNPGASSGSTWSGSIDCSGWTQWPGCVDLNLVADDELDWSTTPVTETLTNIVLTVTSSTCLPTYASCTVVFDDPWVLEAPSFPAAANHRTGTFEEESGAVYGSYFIYDETACFSSGLAAYLDLYFGGSSSYTPLDITWDKDLEVAPPPPPTHELVIDGTYDVLGTTTITDCDGNAGTISGSIWSGTIDCDGVNGTPGCFDQNISATDTLNWGVSPVTETLSNIVITVTADSSCSGGLPVTCIVSLGGSRVLESSFFPLFFGHRTGTFIESSGMTVGAYTITDGGNCVASGYAALFTMYLGSSPSAQPFDVSWAKDLTI